MTIQSIPFSDREAWLAMRRQDVTASVAAALLGVHPWTTAFRLFNLKAGISSEDDEDNPAMRRGRLLEPVAVDLMRADLKGWEIEYPVGRYYRDPIARIGATPDVLVTDDKGRRGVVQIKTVMPRGYRSWLSEEDRDSRTIEPPLWIAIQAIIEATLTGAEVAYVAPFVLDDRLACPLIEVPIHAAIYDRLREDVAEFWQRVKDNRPYAPDYKRDAAEIIKLYPEDNGEEIDLSFDNQLPEMVDQLVAARASKKAAEDLEDEAKGYIADKIGEASVARLADGRRVSHKQQSRNVKCKHLEGAFCSQSKFRVTRVIK